MREYVNTPILSTALVGDGELLYYSASMTQSLDISAVGSNIAEIRRALGLSRHQLSSRISELGGEISPRTLERIETDGIGLKVPSLLWISFGLGCDLGRLLQGLPTKPPVQRFLGVS